MNLAFVGNSCLTYLGKLGTATDENVFTDCVVNNVIYYQPILFIAQGAVFVVCIAFAGFSMCRSVGDQVLMSNSNILYFETESGMALFVNFFAWIGNMNSYFFRLFN